MAQQKNAPVDLQMGTALPFVASCMGLKTRGHFLMTPSCLNLFWIVIVAPGTGKSQSRNVLLVMHLNTSCPMDMSKWKILKFLNLHMQVIYILFTNFINEIFFNTGSLSENLFI